MAYLASFGLPQYHQSLFSAFPPEPHLLQRSTIPFHKHQHLTCLCVPQMSISSSSSSTDSKNGFLSSLAPLEAILFDIDGTLCDSDPLHFYAFRKLLQEVGFNGGVPITEEFFIEKISGGHNEDLCGVLFPDWDLPKARKFIEDKEDSFLRLTSEKLKSVRCLTKLCNWIEHHGLKRAAVTNAPGRNGELMLSVLGLTDFFPTFIVGEECEPAKPFPDPYLKALQLSTCHISMLLSLRCEIWGGSRDASCCCRHNTRNPEKLLADAGAIFIKDFGDPKLWIALRELERKAEVAEIAT